MTEAILFGVGALVGLFMATVWYAVQWNDQHQQMVEWKEKSKAQADIIVHLEQIVHPEHWLDASDVAVNIAKKERLYDKHPDLVRPGSEVIIINEEDDIPRMSSFKGVVFDDPNGPPQTIETE
jgi:hypothetical protein